jgi:hypothetical protein
VIESLGGGVGEVRVVGVWGFPLMISKDIRGLGTERSSLLGESLRRAAKLEEMMVKER